MTKTSQTQTEITKTQSWFISLIGLIAMLIPSLVTPCAAATGQASATLALRIEPAASVAVTPLASADQAERLYKVELVVRMNPGTTTSLSLDSDGGESRIVFTAQQNGRYAVTIAVKSGSNADFALANNARLEVISSDGAIHLINTF